MLIKDINHLENVSDSNEIKGAFSRSFADAFADAFGAARAETFTYTETYAYSFEADKQAYSISNSGSEANV